jgi:hypothetical protein
LDKDSWINLIPLVTSVINGTPTKRLNNLSPCEVFLGRKNGSILDAIVHPTESKIITKLNWTNKLNNELISLKENWNEMLDSLREKKENDNKISIKDNNDMIFKEGDLVMFALSPANATEKLARKWKGPMTITKVISFHQYLVKDEFEGKEFEAHPARLKLFKTKESASRFDNQRIAMSDDYVMHNFENLTFNQEDNKYMIIIKWKGNHSWTESKEDAKVVSEEYPTEFEKFLQKYPNNEIVEDLRNNLSQGKGGVSYIPSTEDISEALPSNLPNTELPRLRPRKHNKVKKIRS